MIPIKEITVFTVGDSESLSTWSNVPYFFSKSLEERGIKINRINIEENSFLNKLYKYTVYAFLKLFYKNSSHSYFRSGINYFLTNIKIKRTLKKYSSSQAYIFLTYSFYQTTINSKKTILFSDWSYLYMIRNFYKREPFWFEKKSLQREQKHINSADVVLSLFPGAKDFNTANYQNQNCYYLGNVINSFYPLNKKELVSIKATSIKLLFIGNKKYLQGATDLIKAFKELKKRGQVEIELHMIGINEKDTSNPEENIFYYGYLDKGNKSENALYYKLLSEAKFIVNTTPDWGAFSAMTEAMYYYTPVITTPYSEFVNTYGKNVTFGFYVNNNSLNELVSVIEANINDSGDSYFKMMNASHEKVKDFTWKNYSDNLLSLLS